MRRKRASFFFATNVGTGLAPVRAARGRWAPLGQGQALSLRLRGVYGDNDYKQLQLGQIGGAKKG
jgi:hypothetical protein